jgi:cytochrome oxidase Cu insertion factor (SCO1/SenC/PrrC family)
VFPEASSARLPIYGAVPDFALIDQAGHSVRKADLEGKVWVADFIFTSCADECPLISAEMARLQSDLVHIPDIRFVSISVDPERDIPAVLSQYADRFNADPERWFFLTGDKPAIHRLVRDGFRLGIIDPSGPSHPSPLKDSALGGSRRLVDPLFARSAAEIAGWSQTFRYWLLYVAPAVAFADHGRESDPLHSTRFVLIDHRAQIRGYYESQEGMALQRLRQHLQILIREG